MSALEKEIQALRMKQSRIDKKYKKESEEIWSRIEELTKLAQENTSGVDAAQKLSPAAQIMINKVAQRRGWK